MSLLTKHGRISAKPFAKVPALGELPEIQSVSASVSTVSSSSRAEGGIDLLEGCMVTKTLKYTHQLAHWVNAVRKGDPTEVENIVERGLHIISYVDFALDDPFEAFVHTSLDIYAFIAVAPSSSTLDGLITMVRSDNHRRQMELDTEGIDSGRLLNFSVSSYTNPEYELVALHPEHFLPVGSVLTVYDPAAKTHKTYVPARDRFLRESPEPSSPRLPAFRHTSENRPKRHHLNVFLVALNAEIKFRRHFEMIRLYPSATPLPDDVLTLMHRTHELIELLYWTPVPTKGSRGEAILAAAMAIRQQNQARAARPDPAKSIQKGSSEEMKMGEGEDVPSPSDVQGTSKTRWEPPWPEDADLETRMAYGRALMSGHDRDYDPELFEDAFPLDDTHPYSDKATVEAWNRGVSSSCASRESLAV